MDKARLRALTHTIVIENVVNLVVEMDKARLRALTRTSNLLYYCHTK